MVDSAKVFNAQWTCHNQIKYLMSLFYVKKIDSLLPWFWSTQKAKTFLTPSTKCGSRKNRCEYLREKSAVTTEQCRLVTEFYMQTLAFSSLIISGQLICRC